LGGEKFKSKGSNRIPTPTWLEQFDLHLFDDQTQELEINVCAKERSREEIVARYGLIFLINNRIQLISRQIEFGRIGTWVFRIFNDFSGFIISLS